MTRLFRVAPLTLLLGSAAFSQVTVRVTPEESQIHIGNELQFAVAVAGAGTDQGVAWAVNGVVGGNGTLGTITAQGRYYTPAALPNPNVVTVTATHRTSGSESKGVAVRLSNPYPMLASVRPSRLSTGPFGVTVNGSGFVPGARVRLGSAMLATTYVSSTRLVAAGTIAASDQGHQTLTVVNPEPGGTTSVSIRMDINQPREFSPRVTSAAAARFLEQAAFGPDRTSIEEVQRLGFAGWIDAQFEEPVSPYQDLGMIGTSLTPVQARFFSNAVHGADQLRQRMTFALAQIWVVSGSLANTPERFLPYLRLLQKNAFGNYRELMVDITLSPTMGDYLNMVNNVKADPARNIRPNENYARELLQLFTVGANQLNPDGSLRLDDAGKPLQTYTQKDIQEFSRALTGWTYPTRPGARLAARNAAFYAGPTEPWEANHDTGAKSLLLGVELPGGRTAAQDLNEVMDNLLYHPNIAPFICRNLIQHLVKSNPGPDYMKRVVEAFDGPGERGDLKRVVRAILLDPEARAGDDADPPAATEGHLREPVLWLVALMRALGAMVNDTNSLASRGSAMGQNIHFPPTVFNYYMPGTKITGSDLLGPEFEILTPTTALERANQVNAIVYGNLGAGAYIDLNGWAALANSPTELLDEVEVVFFRGRMPVEIRRILLDAVINTAGERAKAQAALYLAASSSYFTVQR